MKLRLDEYYKCLKNDNWDNIEDYMPKFLINKLHKINKIDDKEGSRAITFLENTYSYLKVVEKDLIDVIAGYPQYRVIISLNNKYYSFIYIDDWSVPFGTSFNAEQELVEVIPTKITITKYINKKST